jgi:hypothetical protein
MQVEQLFGGVTRYTLVDGYTQIVVAKGGEDIANNTYGFEIEFCSHDSSVFTFTHVNVLHFAFGKARLPEDELNALFKKEAWTVESDSGGVLELVTPPLKFAALADAQRFRAALTGVLTNSVVPTNPVVYANLPILAVTLEDWVGRIAPQLAELMDQLKPQNSPHQCYVRITPWEDIGQQLNMENIDDGINIPAARMRHYANRQVWDTYVGATALSRSEKDWGAGYSSQLNMPMSLCGYFLYCRKKLGKAEGRRTSLLQAFGSQDAKAALNAMSDTALRKNVETWFWRSVLWAGLSGYLDQLNAPAAAKLVWTEPSQGWTALEPLNNMALLYLIANKVVTGAMGALSEPGQLQLQQYAWLHSSTTVMAGDSPAEDTAMREWIGRNLGEPSVNRDWLEYHSAMKDLTGLWFKAPLFDVIYCEEINKHLLESIARMLMNKNVDVWSGILFKYKEMIKAEAWEDGMEALRPSYYDVLADLKRKGLAAQIKQVEIKLGRALEQALQVDNGLQAMVMQGDRATRPFLHYRDDLAWEGRYDTMYSPINREQQGEQGPPRWTYLVEHRFN